MALAALTIDLNARLAKFEQGMDRAGRLLEKLGANATTAGQRVGEIFAGNLLADAAGQALQRLVTFFPQVADGVLAIKDLAEATGSTVEKISALDDFARRAGSSIEEVEGVLIKFNAALKEADGKNGVSQALKAIGLNAKELRELDPADALQRTAVALSQFADDGNKARLTQELFGKGVKAAATLLRDLAEAGQLNATVTAAQAEEVDKFQKNVAALKTDITDLARALLGPVLGGLNKFAQEVRNAQSAYGSATARFFDQFSLDANGTENEQLAKITTRIAGLNAVIAENRELKRPEILNTGLKEEVALLEKREKFLRLQLNDKGGGRGTLARGIGESVFGADDKPKLPFLSDPAKLKEAKKSFEDYQQSLTRGIADMIGKTDTVKLAEIAAQFQKLDELAEAGLDPKIVEQVQRLLSPPLGPNAGPQLSDEMLRVNELLKQTDSAKLAAASRDAKALSDELSRTTAGTQRWLELQDALFDVESQITNLSGTFTEVFQNIDLAALETQRSIEGVLGGSFRAVLEGDFRSIGNMWKDLLIDMASRALAAQLADKLFGAMGSNGARSGGGWVDTFFKLFNTSSSTASAKGNAFDRSGLVRFAAGGVVNGATPFTFGGGQRGEMGEAGPEGILPLKRGRDGKLGVTASGGGRPVFNTTINVSGPVPAEQVQLMQVMLDRSNARLMRSMRTGAAGA